MKSLLTLINEYKEKPSEQLRNIIWKFIMADENGHYFENIAAYKDDGEWVLYGDNLRLKRIMPHVFIATEVAANSFGGYFCLFHIIKLSDYSAIQKEEYKENYPEYMNVCDDEEFFVAASIASVLSVDDAESTFMAEDDIALEAWIARMEDKYSAQTE